MLPQPGYRGAVVHPRYGLSAGCFPRWGEGTACSEIVCLNGVQQLGQHIKSSASHEHSRQLTLYPLIFLAGFDTRQIRQRLPALVQALQGAPARPRAGRSSLKSPIGGFPGAHHPASRCRISKPRYRPNRPFPAPRVKPGVAFGKSDRSTCHWQVVQTVLWHPVFGGLSGRREATGCGASPSAPYPLPFLAGFDTRQIRQRLPALGQVL